MISLNHKSKCSHLYETVVDSILSGEKDIFVSLVDDRCTPQYLIDFNLTETPKVCTQCGYSWEIGVNDLDGEYFKCHRMILPVFSQFVTDKIRELAENRELKKQSYAVY